MVCLVIWVYRFVSFGHFFLLWHIYFVFEHISMFGIVLKSMGTAGLAVWIIRCSWFGTA